MPYLPIMMDKEIEIEPDVQMDAAAGARAMEPLSILVKNRRKRYLDTHPEYFSADLELAGPLALFLSR